VVTTIQETPAEKRPPRRGPASRRPTGFRPHVVGAVFTRNFLGYLSNPAGYVFLTLFVVVGSWFGFWQPEFFARNLANLDSLSAWMPAILLFFVPAITMSLWAEERRQGTDELLLTLPAHDLEVVLGKYLAALGIYTVGLAFLAVGHTLVLHTLLGRPDSGVLAATILGYWLMGAALIAVGMVASALTTSVTVGFILGALFCAIPVFAGSLAPLGRMLAAIGRLPGLGWVGRALAADEGRSVGQWLDSLSIPGQFRDFGSGLVPLTGVLYFVGLAGLMLYANVVLLGRRHWAGGPDAPRRWAHAAARFLALAIALVSLGVIAGRWANVRADLTEERLHSLSNTTRDTLKAIPADRPVFVHAYYSPDVPREYLAVQKNLLNALREFAALGGDRLRLTLVPTARYSEEAREAERRFGITPRRLPVQRDGRQEVEEIYLGVAFTSGPEQVVVPFFDRGLPVEYELTRSIRVATGAARKRVGVLDTEAALLGRSDPRMMGMGATSEWDVVRELRKQYDVASVSPDAPIPNEEVQTIALDGEPTGGSFTLTFEGKSTGPIPYDAAASAVAEALGQIEGLSPADIRVEGGPLPREPIRVAFTGRLAGKDLPDLGADGSALTAAAGRRPIARVATTTRVLDALIVAQPSSLTQAQVDNLTAYIKAGGPTLLLMDPMPIQFPFLAPAEQRTPDRNMMMGRPPEPKGDLSGLLDLLGVQWNGEEIVWNPYNPHRQFELPPEYVFVTRSAGPPDAFGDDPIVSALQEVFLPFPGRFRSAEMPGAPSMTPLLRTDTQGGTLRYSDIVTRDLLGPSVRPARRYIPTDQAYTLAARVAGRPRGSAADAPEMNVVLVADLDLISNSFFEMRRKPVESLDFLDLDNVTLILNAVDSLAGDSTFLALRSRRPVFRTLTGLEAESRRFVDQAQAEREKAENDAREQLDAARKRLSQAVDAIRKSDEYDERTKESMVAYQERVENRRLSLREAEIEATRNQALREIRAREELSVDALRNRVRLAAVLIPSLPVILLGLITFGLRALRENRGANPDRLV
jgi:ABC-type uncharacterized transport system involved in gliding motility auxiliary subunit/ABC-type transport system involved in multi-copper enzyme maturation permease subunit